MRENLTTQQRVRMALTLAATSLVGGLLGLVVTDDGANRAYAFLAFAVAFLPVGLIVGFRVAFPPRRATDHDVEVSWRQRAQSEAFTDLLLVLTAGFLILQFTSWLDDVPPHLLFVAVTAVAIADTTVRYTVLEKRGG